jgi:hypothetical protein
MRVDNIKSLKVNGLTHPTSCFKQLQTFCFCRYIRGCKSIYAFKKDGVKLVYKTLGYALPPTSQTPNSAHLGKRAKGV